MLEKMKKLCAEEEGQGMTEYGLVLGLIAVAAVVSLAFLREEIIEMFENVLELVQNREDTDALENLTN